MPKPPSQLAAEKAAKAELATAAVNEQQVPKAATSKEAEALAKELAGKPFGGVNESIEKMKSMGVSLPPAMIVKLQDAARANARAGGSELTNVSAIVRDALEKAGY